MRFCLWGGIVMIGLSSLLLPQDSRSPSSSLARLAIYYGYPSLVNESKGDVEKAAGVFGAYDVVVLGDGLEFPDKQAGRYPEGDPGEHQRALRMIAAVRRRNPGARFFGYVCLGEIPSGTREVPSLTPQELEERIRLWKKMDVAGIFLDEAGYDFAVVTRKRQNMAVGIIHELGLSAFMNAYFVDHLFSLEDNLPYANGPGKNPEHLPPLLDHRDLFLLESFQVKNGTYESVAAWQPRLNQALEYRRRYGAHIFSTTTTEVSDPFDAGKFSYAWWTAQLYAFDGFSWGEPNFAASSNALPDRHCRLENMMPPALPASSPVWLDRTRFWKKAGNSVVVVDTRDHSVRMVGFASSARSTDIEELLRSPQTRYPLIACGGVHE
ncbi:MAG: hypothetical protein WBW70_00305 [Candidatus Sulfotelmatobacter sp.]